MFVGSQQLRCARVGRQLVWQVDMRPAAASAAQYLVSTGGCRNEIRYVRMTREGLVARSKSVLRATSNSQLIQHGPVTSRKALVSAYKCDQGTSDLYELNLDDPRGRPRKLLADVNLTDAAYDVMTQKVLAVVRNGATDNVIAVDPRTLETTTYWTPPASWRRSLVFMREIRPMSGGEMLLGVSTTAFGGNWALVRVDRQGYESVGTTGTGELSGFDMSLLEEQIAIGVVEGGRPRVHLCELYPVYAGSGADISTQRNCARRDLPPALITIGARPAWSFGVDDRDGLFVAVPGRNVHLDVDGLPFVGSANRPPRVVGQRELPAGTNAVYANGVFDVDRARGDLWDRLPQAVL